MTFGGGYAMLPILQRELVENRQWTTESELTDYFAIGQCTPGVIAVNTATFIGYRRRGALGGVVATLGVVAPSIVIITVIAAFLRNFADYQVVKDAFAGIRVCVTVLIVNTVIKLWKSAITNKTALILCLIVFALSLFTNISTVLLVIASGAAGIALYYAARRAKK